MNSDQILHVMSGVNGFLGVFPANKIPLKSKLNSPFPKSFIANMDTASRPGSHWIAIYIPTPHIIEYFDNFGDWPPKNYTLAQYVR